MCKILEIEKNNRLSSQQNDNIIHLQTGILDVFASMHQLTAIFFHIDKGYDTP